jgi:hypothetical protein
LAALARCAPTQGGQMGARTVPFPVPMTLPKRVIDERAPEGGEVEAGSRAGLVEMATISKETMLR